MVSIMDHSDGVEVNALTSMNKEKANDPRVSPIESEQRVGDENEEDTDEVAMRRS